MMNKKYYLFLIIILLFTGTRCIWAQEVNDGSGDTTNPAGDIDPSTVSGDGSQPGQNITGANVNTYTGNASSTATDFWYNRPGFPMKFERYFHTGITSPNGELGNCWMSCYDISVALEPMPTNNYGGQPVTGAALVMPQQSWHFTSTDNGKTFTAPPGCFLKLQASYDPSTAITKYVVTDKKGIVYKITTEFYGCDRPLLQEIDDLNGNKVLLNWETYLTSTTSKTATNGDEISQSSTDMRLNSISGLENGNNSSNWTVNFSYWDNKNPPVKTTVPGPCFVACVYGGGASLYCQTFCDPPSTELCWTNPTGNRIHQITNTAGDIITFDPNGAPSDGSPIAKVNRAPSELNASYQYYSFQATFYSPTLGFPPSTANENSLSRVIDPLAPAGFRNITYAFITPTPQTGPSQPNLIVPVTQVTNGMHQIMFSYQYTADAIGNSLTSVIGPHGLQETDVYNPNLGTLSQKRFTIDGHPYSITYTRNSNLQPVSILDGNGNGVTMDYDLLGNMTYRMDAEGNQEYYTYNNISRLTNSTDKNLVARSYSYDGYGNLTQINEPGRQTSYSYYSNGKLQSKTDANHHTTTCTYDSNGYLSTVQGPAIGPPENLPGALTTYFHDARGHVTSMTDALQQTTTYSFLNDTFLQEAFYADGTNIQFSYDQDGDQTQILDQNGIATTFIYNGNDYLIKSTQAVGTSDTHNTFYEKDVLGKTLSITDNKGQKITFIYNEQNLTKSTSDAVGKGYINTYDGTLNLHTSRDTRGITKTKTYYKNNRLNSVQFSDGTPTLTYTYDGNGNRTSMTDGVGLKNYTYDQLNRLTAISEPSRKYSLSYSFDAVGNLLTEQNNKVSGTINYSYYENNQLKTVTDTDGMATTYIYDSLNDPKYIQYPNGAAATITYVSTNHRLQSLKNINIQNENLSSFYYSYDNVGNATTITSLNGPATYSYDNLYQLKNAEYPGDQGAVSYVYDGVGNRTNLYLNGVNQATYGYDAGDEMTSGPNGSYSYDGVGNMVNAGGSNAYQWDALNQLVKVNNTNVGPVTYVYEGSGHRVQKISSKGTTNYFYDANSVIVETDINGNVLKSYNPGISFKDQQGNKFFYLHNGKGDVSGLMDAKQELISNYTYDAFGKTYGDIKDANNYRYVGLSDVFSDDDIGLQYMWHRWYDPSTGRFISRDPLGIKGGLNLYKYAQNNPINCNDISGLLWVYNQITGEIGQVNDQSGVYTSYGTGYSGGGGGNNPSSVNNPSYQYTSDVGPLPQGSYDIGGPTNAKGPFTMSLTPSDDTFMNGRNGIYIHGDNADQDQSASTGCLVIGSNALRQQIAQSGDTNLLVTVDQSAMSSGDQGGGNATVSGPSSGGGGWGSGGGDSGYMGGGGSGNYSGSDGSYSGSGGGGGGYNGGGGGGFYAGPGGGG